MSKINVKEVFGIMAVFITPMDERTIKVAMDFFNVSDAGRSFLEDLLKDPKLETIDVRFPCIDEELRAEEARHERQQEYDRRSGRAEGLNTKED